MNEYTAILVDDEEKALLSLRQKIERLFPSISILAAENKPEEGIRQINRLKPDILFLDIEMPRINGFGVLERIDEPQSEVIFVTAYSQYAIQAIQHCAIGYVVKPIDDEDLEQAVSNAVKNLKEKNALLKNKALINNLTGPDSEKKLAIPSHTGLFFVKMKRIIHLRGEKGYTRIILDNDENILSSFSLGKFSELLADSCFFQVHRSHIVHLDKIKKYTHEGYLIMENGDKIPISRMNRDNFLERMKC